MSNRTNGEVLKTIHALEWLGNQSASKGAKPSLFNAFGLRVQLHLEAYRPIGDAISKTAKKVFAKFEEEAGDNITYLQNGNTSFGPQLDRRYNREADELMDAICEEEPKRKPFKLSDFEAVGIFVPQSILSELGPLFWKPDGYDPDKMVFDHDAIEEEEPAGSI